MNNKTEIHWTLHNFCSSECYYCPQKFRGGNEPRHFNDYINIADKLINHYSKLERIINWTFDGGEPLEFFELPMLLKKCKNSGGTVTLHTNGGKNILSWFALEPYLDSVVLTYHYWQNFYIIKYIVDTFKSKNKHVEIIVPLVAESFDRDLEKIEKIKKDLNVKTKYQLLYKDAEHRQGLLNYKEEQLLKIIPHDELQKNRNKFKVCWEEELKNKIKNNPSFTGKKCFAGIEKLIISADGWISTSDCNNSYLGNAFRNDMKLISEPEPCRSQACMSASDQKITKII